MPNKLILYIEDNFQNRRLIKKILGAAGYEVIDAEDAPKGIELAHQHRPALILMDIMMADMDGMEATVILKNSELSHIPVVALTAAAMKGDRERIMASGCDDYLQKPINKLELLDTLRRYLG